MRRSGAPSQVNGIVKRPKFMPPFRKAEETVAPSLVNAKLGKTDLGDSITEHKDEDAPKTTNSATCAQTYVPKKQLSSLQPNSKLSSVLSSNCSLTNVRKRDEVRDSKNSDGLTKYYSVVWCKRSKKKHKNWEGDAVLVVRQRSASIQDMDGKEIGKAMGYKASEIENLPIGSTLMVGGKECEILGEISALEYSSGRCFHQQDKTTANSQQQAQTNKDFVKPFVKPQKQTEVTSSLSILGCPAPVVVGPRFDPNAPGALVMPRPKSSVGQMIVDVVVDPHLSYHLRPHQRAGVVFLYECIMGMKDYAGCGVILADSMGLGKTLQCISLIWTLYKQGPFNGKPIAKKVIIVTPGSLVKNWCSEFQKWLGKERLLVYAVEKDKQIKEFLTSTIYPVLIISYEMFMRSIDDLENVTFDLLVCDEGHRLKNTNIKTSTLLTSLTCRRRIVLTGTPVQNDLQEFYAIVEFVNPGILGSSAAFRRVYENPIVASKQPMATVDEKALGSERAAELNRLTSLFVLRRTQEVNYEYLPPKVETVVFCKPSELQVKLYQKILGSRFLRRCLSGAISENSQHLVCISVLKKLCNDPSLIYECAKEVAEYQAVNLEVENSVYTDLLPIYPENYPQSLELFQEQSGKLSALMIFLNKLYQTEPKEKLVLVSNYTQTLDLLERLCLHNEYKFLRLDGKTPTDKRQHLVELFNSSYSKHFVFLLSSKAGGVGLNLIGASRLVLYDIDWNPANDLQAMARVWRDGQKKTVHIYRFLTTGTIEEKIYQRQVSKQTLGGAIVDTSSSSVDSVQFSKDELRDLFNLYPNTLCNTHDLLNCDCDISETSSCSSTHLTDQPMLIGQMQPHQFNPLGTKTLGQVGRNLKMDELKKWNHLQRPVEDELLSSASELITFLFVSGPKSM